MSELEPLDVVGKATGAWNVDKEAGGIWGICVEGVGVWELDLDGVGIESVGVEADDGLWPLPEGGVGHLEVLDDCQFSVTNRQ